jgi:RNA polymerase sigma-70 factor, ECF subfamily
VQILKKNSICFQPFSVSDRQIIVKQKQELKIVALHQELETLIRKAGNKDRQAQKVLYNRYAPKLLSVCRQYISDIYAAEDVMVSAFMKIFTNLDRFENRGNFEAWIRRIAVNESISYIRANSKVRFIEDSISEMTATETSDSALLTADIQALVDKLPEGCKMVFMMYAVEGYKHHEIAAMLNISEGTSKSQLSYARKILQSLLQNINNQSNESQNRR